MSASQRLSLSLFISHSLPLSPVSLLCLAQAISDEIVSRKRARWSSKGFLSSCVCVLNSSAVGIGADYGVEIISDISHESFHCACNKFRDSLTNWSQETKDMADEVGDDAFHMDDCLSDASVTKEPPNKRVKVGHVSDDETLTKLLKVALARWRRSL